MLHADGLSTLACIFNFSNGFEFTYNFNCESPWVFQGRAA